MSLKAETNKIKPVNPNKKATSDLLEGKVHGWAKKDDKAVLHILFYPTVTDDEIDEALEGITQKETLKITSGKVVTIEIDPNQILDTWTMDFFHDTLEWMAVNDEIEQRKIAANEKNKGR